MVDFDRGYLGCHPLSQTSFRVIPFCRYRLPYASKIPVLLEQLLYEQPVSLDGINQTSGQKVCKYGEVAQKRVLPRCIFMGTNRLGRGLVQCIHRAKSSSKEVIQVFGSVIQDQSILINDGLFSNDALIKQNQLTRLVVSDQHEFTPVIHLNTVNNMHSGFKKLDRQYRGVSTKYLNRYLALYVFMRRFMGMDDQEKLMVFLAKTKETFRFLHKRDG